MNDISGIDGNTLDMSHSGPSERISALIRRLGQGRQLSQEHRSHFLDALRILADGSRREDSREAFGSTGLLDYAMELQATDPDMDVRRESLRMIANACADTDSNRDRVIGSSYFNAMLGNLFDATTGYVALAALYNISLDYEPAQQILRDYALFLELIALLEHPAIGQSILLQHVTGLISFAIEDYDVDRSPDSVLKTLFRYIVDTDLDLDGFMTLRSAILAHLKIDRFKNLLIRQGLFERLLVSILRSFGYTGSSNTKVPTRFTPSSTSADDNEDVQSLQTSLVAALRDITSTPLFFEKYSVDSETILTCFAWLNLEDPSLQLISCCMLSNYARAKEQWAERIVTEYNAHSRLIDLCAKNPDSHVALAALEFLLQLARPSSNRTRICNASFLDKISVIWATDAGESGGLVRTQYASVAVLLGLITESPEVVRQLTGLSTAKHTSHIQSLLECFARSNDKKIKIETAKVIMEITKVIARQKSTNGSANGTHDNEPLWQACLSVQPTFVSPIAMIVSQADDLRLQAQGYLTLVIVARQDLGLPMVMDVLQEPQVLDTLIRALQQRPLRVQNTGHGPPENVDSAHWEAMQRSVFDNAMFLVKQIVDREVRASRIAT